MGTPGNNDNHHRRNNLWKIKFLNIKISGNSAARIKIKIQNLDKLALIDTGAGRSCLSEGQYNQLGMPPMRPYPTRGSVMKCIGEVIERSHKDTVLGRYSTVPVGS